MNNIASARAAILDLGSEDAYSLADARVYAGGSDPDRAIDHAREALGQLISEGHVELVLGKMARNEWLPVPKAQVDSVLRNPAAWEPKLGSEDGYAFYNTKSGDALYGKGQPG